jgi:trehalose 6-phosphate phosphatase
MQRLGDLPLREVFGNHGLEPWHTSQNELLQVSSWKESLSPRLNAIPGVWIEDKCYSLSIHYRQAAPMQHAKAQILAALEALGEARVVAGKCVYNVMPNRITHKGTVFGEAMHHFGCACALYVGDDHTDEDVFASCDPAQVLSVRIGKSPTSQAGYYLHSQAEMDDLLELLIES